MKTGPVRGNKSSHRLTLALLLMAALCLEAMIIERRFKYVPMTISWTDARHYCQRNDVDLITMKTVDGALIAQWLDEIQVGQVWIGLLRDPMNDSVWKWINVKSGEGISGDDVSQSSSWAADQASSHCAVVSLSDRLWHSLSCTKKRYFYCSLGDSLIHHDFPLDWHEASKYCRDRNYDLATINQANADRLYRHGWIGLYREAGETWRWIGDLQSDYRNWAPNEPLNADCASYDSGSQKYVSNVCNKELPTLCYDDNLVLVNESKTWEDAVKHCWDLDTPCGSNPCIYQHSLLSLEYLYEYNYVRDRIYRATADEFWTGLRFLGDRWWWVNGHQLEDRAMLPDCPPQQKHCGTISKNDTDRWTIRDCSEKRNFICYRFKVWRAEEN